MNALNRLAAGVLLGCLLVAGFSGQKPPIVAALIDEPPEVTPAPAPPAEKPERPAPLEPLVIPEVLLGEPQPSPASDLKKFIHRIRIGNSYGSCVAIGDRRFVTCWHVVTSGGHQAVQIDGRWARGQWTYEAERDVAVFTSDRDLPGCDISTDWPAYLADATAVGLPGIGDEHAVHSGQIADADLLAVAVTEPGIEQGESGGGVFVAGKLVGILRGYSGGGEAPANPRAGKFTPLAAVTRLFNAPHAQAPAAAPAAAAAKSGHWEIRCGPRGCYWIQVP